MEREIFRGKRPNSGKWIEGYPYKESCFAWILSPRFRTPECSCQVLSETVGQFTGFTDKNGKKVFDGDIVRGRGDCTYFIKFCNGAYDVFHCRVHDPDGGHYRWGLISRFGELNIEIEIIGNIHDNPELLK